jgi:hypothetical protein
MNVQVGQESCGLESTLADGSTKLLGEGSLDEEKESREEGLVDVEAP